MKSNKILAASCQTWQTDALNSVEMSSESWQWLGRKYKSFRKVQSIFQKQTLASTMKKMLQNRTVALLARSRAQLLPPVHAGLD